MTEAHKQDSIHTQCPYCNTLFQITSEQLTLLEGKVRCGYCYRTFNARDTLINTLAETPQAPAAVQINLAKPDTKALETIDLAKQELHASALKQLDTTQTRQKTAISFKNITWLLCLALLMATLVLQYAYFYRGDLAQQHEPLRPWLNDMCQHLHCTLPLIKAPQQLQLISHDMRSHPSNKNALRVKGTFVNNASFSQPYPIIRLNLTDLNGKVVAHRDFAPISYLSQTSDIAAGVPPAGHIDTKLDILDQPANIVGFSLEAL